MMEGRSDTARRRPTVASSSIAVAAAKAVPAKRESTPVTESCLTAADGSSVVPLLLPVAEHARGVSMVERATASAAPIASSSTAAVCAGEGAEPTPQPTPQCSHCPAPKGGQVLSMGACVELDGSEVLCALCHAAFGRTRPASRVALPWVSNGKSPLAFGSQRTEECLVQATCTAGLDADVARFLHKQVQASQRGTKKRAGAGVSATDAAVSVSKAARPDSLEPSCRASAPGIVPPRCVCSVFSMSPSHHSPGRCPELRHGRNADAHGRNAEAHGLRVRRVDEPRASPRLLVCGYARASRSARRLPE
jgi:hypothetical protein